MTATPAAIARRLELLVADADEAITAGRDAAFALGFLLGRIDHLIEKLDEVADSDPTPPHGIERPTYHEPMPMQSSQWDQRTDNDGNIWWTEFRSPKKDERYIGPDGTLWTAEYAYKAPRHVIVGGPL